MLFKKVLYICREQKQIITKNKNNMKKAINNFKQQDTAVKIGLTFVGTFIIPMLIFIAVNIASGNVSNF